MYRYDKKSGDKGWGTQLSRDPRKQRSMINGDKTMNFGLFADWAKT